MHTHGFYYDGLSSDRVMVEMSLAPGLLSIRGPEVDIAIPLASVAIVETMGKGRNVLRFADGGQCVFEDASFLDLVAAAQGRRKGPSFIRRWEKSLKLAVTALLIVTTVVAATVRYGVPWLSHKVAFMVPPEIEKRLGEDVLETLDKFFFEPSGLPEEDMERLRLVFDDVAREAALGANARILFRKGGMLGANALAIPSGIVVMTDELVRLADDDQEIAAVMAHEAGHARGRHGMRHLLQNSMTVLLVSATIGDLASISSLAATAPTFLINAKYSRDFEREADDAAARYLSSRDIPLQKFADILGRLEAGYNTKSESRADLQEQLDDIKRRLEELKRRREKNEETPGTEVEPEQKPDEKTRKQLEALKQKLEDHEMKVREQKREKEEELQKQVEELEQKLEIRRRLEADRKRKQEKGAREGSYLSSHPPTSERIKRLTTFHPDGS